VRIVADTSALIAVVFGEDDAEFFLTQLQISEVLVSAVSRLEAGMVAEARQGLDAARDLELLLSGLRCRTVAFDEIHALVAKEAWRRFGKGRHPAGLNFGDCASYATAKIANAPLLFKGEDFSQTDLTFVSLASSN